MQTILAFSEAHVQSLEYCTAHPQHLFKRVNLGLDINKMAF